MWLHYARRTVQVGGENRTQIVVGFASSRANNINNWRVKVDLISFIGSPGKQSRYTAEVYRNAPETSPPPTPSGGTINVDTGVVTPPASWSGTIISPGTGQRVFACRATVNPVMETGILTPTWSGVYTLGSEGLDGDDGEDGSVWSIGLGFPTTPKTGDVHLFNDNVAGGLIWQELDGTDLVAAGRGDYARYDGADWVRQGRLDGSGAIILPDSVIRYPWRDTLSARYTAASQLDVDGLPPFGGAFLLSDFVDEGGSSRRYLGIRRALAGGGRSHDRASRWSHDRGRGREQHREVHARRAGPQSGDLRRGLGAQLPAG